MDCEAGLVLFSNGVKQCVNVCFLFFAGGFSGFLFVHKLATIVGMLTEQTERVTDRDRKRSVTVWDML